MSKVAQRSAQWAILPASLDDAERVASLVNGYYERWTGKPWLTAADLRADWGRPTLDLTRDSALFLDHTGALVGYGVLWGGEPWSRVCLQCYVAPESNGEYLAPAISLWAQKRAAETAILAPDKHTVLWQERLLSDAETLSGFTQAGWKRTRYSLQMGVEMDAPPVAPSVLDEVRIRPFERGAEDRAMFQTMITAFRDHWGVVERPLDEELAEWLQWLKDSPGCSPDLMLVALDGDDQIVGTVFGQGGVQGADTSGWVFGLGVVRPWRRRGVATALLRHVLCAMYAKGIDSVSLVVDADNLTGATGLYEKAGFAVEQRLAILEFTVPVEVL